MALSLFLVFWVNPYLKEKRLQDILHYCSRPQDLVFFSVKQNSFPRVVEQIYIVASIAT